MLRSTRRGFATPALLLAGTLLLAAGPVSANSDYAKARVKAVAMAEGLQSYDLKGTLAMANNVKGQTGGMTMEADLAAAARWPDRLRSTQQGSMFQLDLGTGPEQSWFYLGQLGNAYIGESVALTRDLDGAAEMDLSEARIFNFYAGLGQFLLPDGLQIAPQTEQEVLTVGGREIKCQVFTTMGPEVVTGSEEAVEGPRRFHFDPASGLVLRSELTVYGERNGVTMEQKVTFSLASFTLNGEIGDEGFSYAPPPGARVVNSLERLTNPDAMTGQVAPEITFTGLDGKSFKLSDLRGEPVFIDFWATWCPPCKQEMPHIETLYKELGAAGKIRIIAASSEDQPTIEGFLARQPYSFPIVRVSDAEAHGKFKTTSIPAGFVIDAEGVIRAHMIGAQTEAQLRAAFAKAGVK